MSQAWRDARGALSWGFWGGFIVAMVWLTIDAVLQGAASGASADLDRAALLRNTAIAFVAGSAAGAWGFLYLRELEKKAERRLP